MTLMKENCSHLQKREKEAGIELFVMDDGWFAKRDNDTRSLGDWAAKSKETAGRFKGDCR